MQSNRNIMKNTIMINGKRKVCRIYDAGDSFADRYTVAFKAERDQRGRIYYPYLASGNNPFHPQAFGMHCESDTFLNGKHLGKRVEFELLPDDVKKFILQSI